jgi:hypothetical protein
MQKINPFCSRLRARSIMKWLPITDRARKPTDFPLLVSCQLLKVMYVGICCAYKNTGSSNLVKSSGVSASVAVYRIQSDLV